MEEKMVNEDESGYKHGKCCTMCGLGHKHFLLRWLLGLVVLMVVFWLGVKIGEFKGEFKNGFYGHYEGGRNMMFLRQGGNATYFQGGMMRAYPISQGQFQTASSTPAQK